MKLKTTLSLNPQLKNHLKTYLIALLTVIGIVHESLAQNDFPTSKGSYIRLDGGGINIIKPGNTGGWARGTTYYQDFNASQRIFGFGMYGVGESSNRFYLGYGNTPWNSVHGMHILPNGNVGIGIVSPVARLTVNGNILAKEIKVTNTITVPDYVFDTDYNLPTLSYVEAYVKKNKHLPEIPSAEDIERNGLDVGEMNLLLLKKVEELTLHLIEKEKKINSLENRLTDIERELFRINDPI